MKKIISLILCCSIFLGLAPQVYAKENTYAEIKIDVGNGVLIKTAIISNNDLYLPATFYSEITRFTYNEDNLMFLIDGQEQNKAFKTVKVNKKNESLLISATRVIELPDIIDVDGELYLPLSVMLPVLNANVVDIIDGVIYITNNELSLSEVLYNFDISDYIFDYASEFAGSVSLGVVSFTLPNYLLDSLTHIRWDRLDIISKTGDYNDYLKIFTEYLIDDEVYLTAVETEDPSEWMSLIGSTQTINKYFKTAFEWGEAFEQKYASSYDDFFSTNDYFDYLGATLPYPYDLEDMVGIVNKGDFSVMDALEVIEFFFNYWYQVEDHRKMLDAVYQIDGNIAWNDAERKAARQIYNIYGGDAADGLIRGVWDKFCESAVDLATTPIKMYELTAQVTGIVMEVFLPHEAMKNASEISRLLLYEDVMHSSLSAFYKYNDNLNTDDDVNNLRHSVLMTLISSRSCYNVMLNAAQGYQDRLLATDYSSLISYYESKIDKINAMICLMYKVADNVEYDSYEHFEEFSKEIKQKLKQSKLLNKQANSESKDDAIVPSGKDQVNTDTQESIQSRYKIDRLFTDYFIVRNPTFREVKKLSEIDAESRLNLGFYESASPLNVSRLACICNGYIFYQPFDYGEGHHIKRISPDGTISIIRVDPVTAGYVYPTIIGEKDGSLYLFLCSMLGDGEHQIVRISDCTEDNYVVETVAFIPSTNYQNVERSMLVLLDDGIYFIAENKQNGLCLWRIELDRFEIEEIYKFDRHFYIFSALSSEQIIKVDNESFVICPSSGSNAYSAIFYNSNTQELILIADEIDPFTVGIGSEAYLDYESQLGYIEQDKFFHLHAPGNGTATICYSILGVENSCHPITSDVPYDHYGRPNTLHVLQNHIFYYSLRTDEYKDNTTCELCYVNMVHPEYNTEFNLTRVFDHTASPIDVKCFDDTLFLAMNNYVYYADANYPDKWYDSKLRLEQNSLPILVNENKTTYCVSVLPVTNEKYELDYTFSVNKIEVDFSKPLDGDDGETVVDALSILRNTLGDHATGYAFMSIGQVEINGAICDAYKMGEASELAFFTVYDFAISPYGDVFIYDVVIDEWFPYDDYEPAW